MHSFGPAQYTFSIQTVHIQHTFSTWFCGLSSRSLLSLAALSFSASRSVEAPRFAPFAAGSAAVPFFLCSLSLSFSACAASFCTWLLFCGLSGLWDSLAALAAWAAAASFSLCSALFCLACSLACSDRC